MVNESILSRVRRALDGNKTYLGLGAAAILGILWNYGMVSDKTVEILGVIIGTWTGVSFRQAIKKAERQQ
jgi:hypothetical protein